MSLEHYTAVLSSNLFLQTPLVEESSPESKDKDAYETIVESIKKISSDSNVSRNGYGLLISVANKARDAIIEIDHVKNKEHLAKIFKLWNIRLTLLVLSNELAIAQQEAKRLSVALNKAARLGVTETEKKSIPSNVNIFGDEVPLGLKILIVRLKSIGPNTALSTEYYLILWQLRQKFLDKEEQRGETELKIEILAYGVAANLIAKREYSTFLTQADSIVKSLQGDEPTQQQKNYKDNISFLAILVSFMKGDWDLATLYYKQISSSDNFKAIVSSLQQILRAVDPVLDLKRPTPDPSTRESIDLQHVTSLDDLFELIKEQRITGRILCSLCALFELQLRSSTDHDLLEDQGSYDLSAEILTLWLNNTSKLYGFE